MRSRTSPLAVTSILYPQRALGNAYGAKKDWLQAQAYFQQAIEVANTHQLILWKLVCYINRAETALLLDLQEPALQDYHKAVTEGQGIEDTYVQGVLALCSTRIAMIRKDLPAAIRSLRQAIRAFYGKSVLNHLGVCLGLEAVCAHQIGNIERAVCLFGVVTSRRWLNDLSRSPWFIAPDLEAALAPAKTKLGEAVFTRLYAEGQQMTLEQAVKLALEVVGE